MNKKEFLNVLRKNLQGNLSEGEIQKHIDYYDHYIRSGGGKGLSEEEAIKEIGDPRLIARTILDVGSTSTDAAYEYKESESGNAEKGREGFKFHSLFRMKWYHKVVAALVLFLILAIILALVFSIIQLVFYIIPFLAAVLLVNFLINQFKKR